MPNKFAHWSRTNATFLLVRFIKTYLIFSVFLSHLTVRKCNELLKRSRDNTMYHACVHTCVQAANWFEYNVCADVYGLCFVWFIFCIVSARHPQFVTIFTENEIKVRFLFGHRDTGSARQVPRCFRLRWRRRQRRQRWWSEYRPWSPHTHMSVCLQTVNIYWWPLENLQIEERHWHQNRPLSNENRQNGSKLCNSMRYELFHSFSVYDISIVCIVQNEIGWSFIFCSLFVCSLVCISSIRFVAKMVNWDKTFDLCSLLDFSWNGEMFSKDEGKMLKIIRQQFQASEFSLLTENKAN